MTPREDEIARLRRAAGMLLACADVVLHGRGDSHNCATVCAECRQALGAIVAAARAEIRGGR